MSLLTGKIWNAVTGEEVHSFQHNHIVKSVAFDRTSQYLVTGSNEKLVRIFDLNQPNAANPITLSGHAGNLKRAIFCRNDQCVISIAEDKTLRVWDKVSVQEVQRIEFPTTPNSLELSKDGSIFTVTHGQSVSFWDTSSLSKVKEISMPTLIASASLHPDKHTFVAGGEDFKMYKYDYLTGNEIGE